MEKAQHFIKVEDFLLSLKGEEGLSKVPRCILPDPQAGVCGQVCPRFKRTVAPPTVLNLEFDLPQEVRPIFSWS